MSIKGFYINGSVQKYDYKSLDNIDGGTGLTEQAKQALLACFEQVAWIGQDGQSYYDALEEALYPQGYVEVTNNLTGCRSTNDAITAAVGKPYTATIIADSGYSLTGAEVSITMGGTSVTGYYSNGTISIPNVTGDLVITVTAVSAVSSISAVYTAGQDTPKTIDPTRINAYINADGAWVSASDSYSVCVPVTVGRQYNLQFTTTDSSLVGTFFRVGFTDTNTPSGQSLSGVVRSTPQDMPNVTATATGQYLAIQLPSSVAYDAITNGYLTLTELAKTIYDTDTLDSLKADLVVTAHYSDSSTQTVPAADYTLSGTLTAGTSTITVSYGGKTTTFSVTVIEVTLFAGKYVDFVSFYYASSNTKLVYYNDSTTFNRLAYVLDGTGSHAIPKANTSQGDVTIYPIPIPATAVKLIARKDNDEQGTLAYISKWDGSQWARVRALGATYGTRWVKDISDINDGSLYVAFSSRNVDNDGDIVTDDRTNWIFGWADA